MPSEQIWLYSFNLFLFYSSCTTIVLFIPYTGYIYINDQFKKETRDDPIFLSQVGNLRDVALCATEVKAEIYITVYFVTSAYGSILNIVTTKL